MRRGMNGVGIGCSLAVAATALACAGNVEEGASTGGHARSEVEAYDQPETPTIKPGSLRGFEVAPDGSVRDILAGAKASIAGPSNRVTNWDWGDEGVYQPTNSGSSLELEDILNPGQVLMGFGARVSTDAVSRMHLRAISIRDDWSWDPVGATWQDWVRLPEDNGDNTAELELAVVKPYVVVGVGLGITNHNLAVIRLRKRQYSPSQHQLTGAEYEDAVGTGPGELYWDTSFVTQTAAEKAKMVVVGLGVREYNDNMTTLRVWVAYLD